jgi:hypothetical protein
MNCPYLMSDGRTFTDYRSSTIINTDISLKNKVPQNSYNSFLVNNGLNYQRDSVELNSFRCKNDFGNCYTNVNIQDCDFDVCKSMLELKD